MGLFDKMNTDGTGSTGTFVQGALAFAKLDLNSIFKQAIPAAVAWITYAGQFFSDVFGHSDCNDQDRVLVERFQEQIPYMMTLLVKQGYYDQSIADYIGEDQHNILQAIAEMGRPHYAHPCNELIYPARLLFTILFGVRITNSNFLDALDRGVSDYYTAAGSLGSDIPRIAVQRAVMLKQKYFPSSTYNTQQWDLNKFQEWPLVAPVPDPETTGKLYTGEFLGINVVDGMILGDPIPDVQEAINALDPNYIKPLTQPITVATGNLVDKIISFVKTNPLQAAAVGAALWFAWSEIEDNN